MAQINPKCKQRQATLNSVQKWYKHLVKTKCPSMYQKHAPTCRWSPNGLFWLNTGWHWSFHFLIRACAVNTGSNGQLDVTPETRWENEGDDKPVYPRKNSMYQNSQDSRRTTHNTRVHIKMHCYTFSRGVMLTKSNNIIQYLKTSSDTLPYKSFHDIAQKKVWNVPKHTKTSWNLTKHDKPWKTGPRSKLLQHASNCF